MANRKKPKEKATPEENDPVSKKQDGGENEKGKTEIKGFMMRSSRGHNYSFEQIGDEKYTVFEREFEITVWKDLKRKKILLLVNETGKVPNEYLPQFDIEYKVENTELPLVELSGYPECMNTIKGWLDTHANTTADHVKNFLWAQFGASIDMLKNAIVLWPDEFWESDKRFFYNAYHALILLDYYMSDPSGKFKTPLPFTLTDMDATPDGSIGDMIPDRIYSRSELLDYADQLRNRCKFVISTLTDKTIASRWVEKYGDMDYANLEILFYNMRHVQHHAAQLNMLLRQKINDAPKWVFRADNKL